jgi:hypothetical protein
VAGVLRHLGLDQAGGTHAHLSRTIKAMGLDTSHFIRHQNGAGPWSRRLAGDILVVLPRGAPRTNPALLRRALAGNLRYLCPNCHSQTESFAGRSRGKYTQVDAVPGPAIEST